ncbi:MAG: potassium channel protein, partial [Cyanobium sp. MED843]
DINPTLPLSRMVSVATSIAGPLYLAAVMGVLIGRFASSLDQDAKEPDKTQKRQ